MVRSLKAVPTGLWQALFGIMLAGLLLGACIPSPNLRSGNEATIAPGDTADIGGGDLKVTFLDVAEDSRCPLDVTCITAGRAIARITLDVNGKRQDSGLEFIGTRSQAGVNYESFHIVFSLSPSPVSTKRIEKKDYRLSVIASKQ
ncbi:MAG: hypothetical protein EXR67_06960 [Dehalococcoidia bacterium]|nr:hypothetical protein [Dehalococcoidia bacterium]